MTQQLALYSSLLQLFRHLQLSTATCFKHARWICLGTHPPIAALVQDSVVVEHHAFRPQRIAPEDAVHEHRDSCVERTRGSVKSESQQRDKFTTALLRRREKGTIGAYCTRAPSTSHCDNWLSL